MPRITDKAGRELVAERDYLLRFLTGGSPFEQFPELSGLSARAMAAKAIRDGELVAVPHDGADLGRCEMAYAAAPPHLQKRMLPILEQHRSVLRIDNHNEKEKGDG